jgi:hypothetical protein
MNANKDTMVQVLQNEVVELAKKMQHEELARWKHVKATRRSWRRRSARLTKVCIISMPD